MSPRYDGWSRPQVHISDTELFDFESWLASDSTMPVAQREVARGLVARMRQLEGKLDDRDAELEEVKAMAEASDARASWTVDRLKRQIDELQEKLSPKPVGSPPDINHLRSTPS